jgi:hypothetical protein
VRKHASPQFKVSRYDTGNENLQLRREGVSSQTKCRRLNTNVVGMS